MILNNDNDKKNTKIEKWSEVNYFPGMEYCVKSYKIDKKNCFLFVPVLF